MSVLKGIIKMRPAKTLVCTVHKVTSCQTQKIFSARTATPASLKTHLELDVSTVSKANTPICDIRHPAWCARAAHISQLLANIGATPVAVESILLIVRPQMRVSMMPQMIVRTVQLVQKYWTMAASILSMSGSRLAHVQDRLGCIFWKALRRHYQR